MAESKPHLTQLLDKFITNDKSDSNGQITKHTATV